MQNFIVLGIVPGTNFQTTFSFWLAVSLVLGSLPVAIRVWRKRHAVIAVVLAWYIFRQISRRQLTA